MMRLTLSVDASVIEKAKRMAKANGTSVSAMFSHFIESVATPRRRRPKIGPLTRELSGMIALPPDKDYRRLLDDALTHKHKMDHK
jgi:hypothetical protein